MNLPRITIRRNNSTYFLIGTLAVIACILFYFLGFLFIQTVLLIGYVSLFPTILIWEKRKRERMAVDPSRLSEDERWSKTKAKLEKLERRIEKGNDAKEREFLLREKRSLEGELRQLEWQIRESEMTQIYNASKGKVKRVDTPESVITTMSTLDAQFKKLGASRDYLLKTLKETEDIVKEESQASRDIALERIANDLKAQYNAVRRKSKSGSGSMENSEPFKSLLSDYWVCWASINSLARGSSLLNDLAKYASKDFQPTFSKFVKSVNMQ